MKINDIKPSDILKWVIGTKEGYKWYLKEIEQFYRDIAIAIEKQLFGDNDNG